MFDIVNHYKNKFYHIFVVTNRAQQICGVSFDKNILILLHKVTKKPQKAERTLSISTSWSRNLISSLVNVNGEWTNTNSATLVQLTFPTLFGNVYITNTVTPISVLKQKRHSMVTADRLVPRLVAKFYMWTLMTQFDRDIPIGITKYTVIHLCIPSYLMVLF